MTTDPAAFALLSTRLLQMADAWETRLPELIRTPAVVSAIRAAVDSANASMWPSTAAPGLAQVLTELVAQVRRIADASDQTGFALAPPVADEDDIDDWGDAPETMWNGQPCKADRVTVIVADHGTFPGYWARDLVGTHRRAVRVEYDNQVMYLDDEDGSGWAKVTRGGSPLMGHRDLEVQAVIEGPGAPGQEQGAPTDWKAAARKNGELYAAAEGQRDEARAERDGAYRERAQLLAWLAAVYLDNTVITPAADVTEPGWQLLYIHIGDRQLSWHIAPRDTDLFAHVQHVPADHPRAQWDGHTTDQKYEYIRWLADRERVRPEAPGA